VDIKELTQVMHIFVSSMGWYEPNSKRPQTLRNLAVSLNLEASEVLEYFQWGDQHVDQIALASELADVALYLLQLASLSGIDLEKAIMSKLQINYQRTWDGDLQPPAIPDKCSNTEEIQHKISEE
jgi:NTP pyrophosphatase (non-canonical NTP hydrolase)